MNKVDSWRGRKCNISALIPLGCEVQVKKRKLSLIRHGKEKKSDCEHVMILNLQGVVPSALIAFILSNKKSRVMNS